MASHRTLISVVALALVLAGCGGGGGGSSSSTPEPSGVPFEFGTLSGRAAISSPPKTTNSYQVTATGLVGLITGLRVRDQVLSPSESRIVFSSDMGNIGLNSDLWSVNLDGSELVKLTDTPGINEGQPSASPDGSKIAFTAVGNGGDIEIWVMNSDGTGRVQITENAASDSRPRWSPNGQLIVYRSGSDIHVINVASKAVTMLTNDAFNDDWASFTPDGQTVIFSSFNRSGALWQPFTVPIGGGLITQLIFSGNDVTSVEFAPDGANYAYQRDGSQILYGAFFSNMRNGPSTTFGTTPFFWSPDSKKFLYSDVRDGYRAIYLSNLDGTSEQEVLNFGHKFLGGFIPAPKDVNFVGAGGIFGSRLCAFVFSQTGANIRGLVGFDALTPSSVVLTEQTGLNNVGPNLVYSVDADSLTEVSYAHAPYWKPTRVVGGGTPVNKAAGALVSIDSITGRVVAVLPFTGVRSGRGFEDQGDIRVFQGNFLAAYDQEGKNLGAASEVRLDIKTGELSVER